MNKRVLVVDDNPVSQKITAGLIHSAGFETNLADSAEAALEQISATGIDLVVTSLRLPGKDGLALTRALKNRAEWKSIPVILLTAAHSHEEELEAVEAGCECALAKPVDVQHFPGMIGLYLGAPATLPDAPEPALQLPMQELREEFLTSSALECRVILSGFGQRPDFPAIRKALHQWAGVGGTLGYPAITKIARELEAIAANPQESQMEELGLGLSELMDLFSNAKPDDAANEAPEHIADQPAGAASKAPTILISDDDPIVRSAVRRELESSGYRCRIAGDGATTFAMARASAPDAIVLDIKMPEMDGFQVLYALRSAWATRGIPVLMLTASGDESDVRRGILLGANDYMTKPFKPDAVVARVDRLLAK